MRDKHPLKLFSTGSLVALGLSVNSLYSSDLIAHEKKDDKHHHHPEKKNGRGNVR
jgi:hypothetical protein